MVQQKKDVSHVNKTLKSLRDTRNLKNKATLRVGTKSDMIRQMAAKHLSAPAIQAALIKKGYGVYPSEVYRAMNS